MGTGFGLAIAISCLTVFFNLFVTPLPASITEQWVLVVLSTLGMAIGIWLIEVEDKQ